jgi:glutamate 5-kinase
MVAHLFDQPLLVILSVVDGLLDRDPSHPEARPLRLVESPEAVAHLAAATQSSRGTGGMRSKLEAVKSATSAGAPVIIADGRAPRVLERLAAGEELGTLFLARNRSLPAWKRWIGFTIAPRGGLQLDAGAVNAVERGGRSLLAIGLTAVHGEFSKGEVVSLLDPQGREFARGLSNFDSRTVRSIAGQRTAQIESLLGAGTYAEVVHCDNLAVVR